LKERNAFLYKRKSARFTKDPFSATNRHCARDFGLIADGNKVGVNTAADDKLRLNVTVKGKRRTVNATPKTTRDGKANSKAKDKRSNKTYNFSTFEINDKNAATRMSSCPLLKKRIAKLHRANCRRASPGFQQKHVLDDATFNKHWNIVKSKSFNSDDASAQIVQNSIDFLTNRRLEQTCQRPTGGPLSAGNAVGARYPANTFISQSTLNDILTDFGAGRYQTCRPGTPHRGTPQLDCTGKKIRWIQIDYESTPPLIFACDTDVKYSALQDARGNYELNHLVQPGTSLCDLRGSQGR